MCVFARLFVAHYTQFMPYMYICICVCVCVCVYIYIYVYINLSLFFSLRAAHFRGTAFLPMCLEYAYIQVRYTNTVTKFTMRMLKPSPYDGDVLGREHKCVYSER